MHNRQIMARDILKGDYMAKKNGSSLYNEYAKGKFGSRRVKRFPGETFLQWVSRDKKSKKKKGRAI
jgi:hypothetical protein